MDRYIIDVVATITVSDLTVEIDLDAPGTLTEKLAAAARKKLDVRGGASYRDGDDHYVSAQNVTEVTNWNNITD